MIPHRDDDDRIRSTGRLAAQAVDLEGQVLLLVHLRRQQRGQRAGKLVAGPLLEPCENVAGEQAGRAANEDNAPAAATEGPEFLSDVDDQRERHADDGKEAVEPDPDLEQHPRQGARGDRAAHDEHAGPVGERLSRLCSPRQRAMAGPHVRGHPGSRAEEGARPGRHRDRASQRGHGVGQLDEVPAEGAVKNVASAK